MISGLPDPYCTLVYADDINDQSSDWSAASTADREDALQWGRVYQDSAYTYSVTIDDPAPDALQTANAILADYHLRGELFTADGSTNVIASSVKAGSVESSVEYASATGWSDPAPEVTMLLTGYASPTTSEVLTAKLLRS